MPPDIKQIILITMYVKLYSWMLTFCRLLQQQILRVILISASSAVQFKSNQIY